MKILFTGASSFTGYWFVKELISSGHDVTVVFRGNPKDYASIRAKRIQETEKYAKARYNISFGDDAFLDLIKGESKWDLFCHHAADVTNYKSPDFDFINAVQNNTKSIDTTLKLLKEKGCSKIVLTGSVFEYSEGAGSGDLQAFSPYGLSKGLTYEVFRYFSTINEIELGKFVISNPFGPYEEPRFTAYLIKNWFERKVPAVNTPDYIRDNIHVSLLAKAYNYFCGQFFNNRMNKFNPSGYIESQGSFAKRFANEMRSRLDLSCELELKEQKEFLEPRMRVNTEPVDKFFSDWNEKDTWDKLAEYYYKELK